MDNYMIDKFHKSTNYHCNSSNLTKSRFDGDVLNILHIINDAFYQRCRIVFNPRNAMYISRIDGRLNSDLLVQRDTLINANTFLYLGRNNYNDEDLAKIKAIKERQKEYFVL